MKIIDIHNACINKIKLKIERFCVNQGDIIKIDGSSGSGKTSFLLSLVKLNKMSFDSYKLEEQNVDDIDASKIRDEIIYIPQLTGSEAINIISFLKKIKQLDVEKVKEKLKNFEIKSIESKNLDQLSGGERQILNLIIAMELPRKVIICDESFSAIDNLRATKLIHKLIQWKGEQRAIVYVSHQALTLDQQVTSTYFVSQECEITELKKSNTKLF